MSATGKSPEGQPSHCASPNGGRDAHSTYTAPPCYPRKSSELVWVKKRLDTTDPRFNKPTPRYKLLMPIGSNDVPRPIPTDLCYQEPEPCDPLVSIIPKRYVYVRQPPPATPSPTTSPRCRQQLRGSGQQSIQWSSLRQMLIDRGDVERRGMTSWGNGVPMPPLSPHVGVTRFPQLGSEMSKFVDEAYKKDPFFSLF